MIPRGASEDDSTCASLVRRANDGVGPFLDLDHANLHQSARRLVAG